MNEEKLDRLIALTEQSLRNQMKIMKYLYWGNDIHREDRYELSTANDDTRELLTNKDNSNDDKQAMS